MQNSARIAEPQWQYDQRVLRSAGIIVGALVLIGLAIWGITRIFGGGSDYEAPIKTFMDALCDKDLDKMNEAYLPSQREDFDDATYDRVADKLAFKDITYTIGEAEKVEPEFLTRNNRALEDEIRDATAAYNVEVDVELSTLGFTEHQNATLCVMKYKGTWYLVGIDGLRIT